jgi:hypothetical protein
MKRIGIILFFLIGFFVTSFAQKKSKLPCIDKEFSVVAQVVKDSLGKPNILEAEIYSLVNSINPYFDSICVSFKLCEIRYIDNFMYDSLKHWDELKNQYHADNRINIYFVENIKSSPGAAGFAGLGAICNTDDDGIVLVKTASTLVLAHEMGHYFGLLHTFQDANDLDVNLRELADGSNSATTGDLITDTPADPFNPALILFTYYYYLTPDPNYPCKFVGVMKDKNGLYFDPLVGNIMSYYPEECNCGFTHEQYQRMAKTFLSNPKMW